MLRFSKKVEYAMIALLHMAAIQDQHLTTARELSGRYNIPLELMGKVLQSLTRAGLILSVQGIKGGYKLNKPLASITVNEVLIGVEGPMKLVGCLNQQPNTDCEQHIHCTIKNPMEIIQARMELLFENLKLQEIEEEIKFDQRKTV
jgi:Rrf2 family protein